MRPSPLIKKIHEVENHHVTLKGGRPHYSLKNATPSEMRSIHRLVHAEDRAEEKRKIRKEKKMKARQIKLF